MIHLSLYILNAASKVLKSEIHQSRIHCLGHILSLSYVIPLLLIAKSPEILKSISVPLLISNPIKKIIETYRW